jgi:hypothetical protein
MRSHRTTWCDARTSHQRRERRVSPPNLTTVVPSCLHLSLQAAHLLRPHRCRLRYRRVVHAVVAPLHTHLPPDALVDDRSASDDDEARSGRDQLTTRRHEATRSQCEHMRAPRSTPVDTSAWATERGSGVRMPREPHRCRAPSRSELHTNESLDRTILHHSHQNCCVHRISWPIRFGCSESTRSRMHDRIALNLDS